MTVSARKAKPSFRERWRSLDAKETRLAWLLILPTALIVFSVVLFPAIFSIWISFHDVGLKELGNVFEAEFVGLDNYRSVVDDFAFKYQGLRNWGAAVTSVVYSIISTIVTITLGLIAALLLNRPFRARGVTRAVFLFPYVAPIVSVAFVWKWIMDPRPSGVINDILMRTGVIEPARGLAGPARPGPVHRHHVHRLALFSLCHAHDPGPPCRPSTVPSTKRPTWMAPANGPSSGTSPSPSCATCWAPSFSCA